MKKINWRYAIGELLIVIIGISVAFALNNWSASLKENDLKDAYLSNLKADIEHDAEALTEAIAEMEKRSVFLQRTFIPIMFNTSSGSDSIVRKFYGVIDPVVFSPRDATLQSLKFSGDLKLIDDLQLKNKILQHYETYESAKTERERHIGFAKDYLGGYFMRNIDFSKTQAQGGLEFLKDPYFRNLTFSFLGINTNQLTRYKEALVSAEALLQALD